MKKRFLSLISVLLAAVISVSLCACREEESDEGEDSVYLILVNKNNAIGAEYVPEELVDVDTAYTTGGKAIQLDKTACEAATRMLDAMKEAGITNVTITSGYRTYEYQKKLFDRYCANEASAHPDWSEEEVREQVLTYSAAPGTSEHQTGLCMDLFTTEMEGLWNYGSETLNNPYDKGFAETDAYEWLCRNAYKYGFILRFPDNKTDITGYAYESWHYRYVGEDAAREMHKSEKTLEEFLEK